MPPVDLDAELAALPAMTMAELRRRWLEVTNKPVPRLRHSLLRMALAYELQAAVYGALSRRSAQRLAELGGHAAPALGIRLVREWQGTLHTVIIDAHDRIFWNGRRWNSLSEVARAITGTRWSGPAFFGLARGKAA